MISTSGPSSTVGGVDKLLKGECGICFELLTDCDKVVQTNCEPNCSSNIFCRPCLKACTKTRNVCPYCQTNIRSYKYLKGQSSKSPSDRHNGGGGDVHKPFGMGSPSVFASPTNAQPFGSTSNGINAGQQSDRRHRRGHLRVHFSPDLAPASAFGTVHYPAPVFGGGPTFGGTLQTQPPPPLPPASAWTLHVPAPVPAPTLGAPLFAVAATAPTFVIQAPAPVPAPAPIANRFLAPHQVAPQPPEYYRNYWVTGPGASS